MDNKELQKKITLYYSKLPKNVQEVFSSMAWMDTIDKIATKSGLNKNQIETLGTETTLALLGIIHLDKYEEILKNELNIPNETLQKIFEEINEGIFKSISDDLVETFNKNTKSVVEEKYGSSDKLDARFKKLPESVQSAISESNYQEALYAIATSHKLPIDKMGDLEEVTTKVLLGIIHPDQYENELGLKIVASKDEISKIVSEVNEQILKSIRDILKKNWGDGEEILSNSDDEVPIPPYAISAITSREVEPMFKMDKSILEKIPEIQKESPILSKTESDIYGNAGIEINEGVDLIESKLKGVTLSKNTVSTHIESKSSNPKLPPVSPQPIKEAPTTKTHDPYHEPLD